MIAPALMSKSDKEKEYQIAENQALALRVHQVCLSDWEDVPFDSLDVWCRALARKPLTKMNIQLRRV